MNEMKWMQKKLQLYTLRFMDMNIEHGERAIGGWVGMRAALLHKPFFAY